MPKNDIQKQGRILMLPVDCIEPSPYQARTAFDEPEIAALAVSILQNGLLQPISVRRVGIRKYQLVAGERRLRACRLAKLEKVPAILADYDDSESAALGLLENLQRSQLDPFDTARGIKEVIRLWGCTQAEAARRLGLSQPALANKLRLLTLTAEQQQLCTANPGAGKDGPRQDERAAGRQAGGPDAGGPGQPQSLPPHDPDGAGCTVLCEHAAARCRSDDPKGDSGHHAL